MNEAELKAKLLPIFRSFLPSLKSEKFDFSVSRTKFSDWDSLTHMQLASEIETAFGVSFEMEDLVSIETPADFISLIKKKQA